MSERYRFGDFIIDIAERTLYRGTQPVQMTIKAFDTLAVLVKNNGRVLLKEELLETIWPDTIVEENNLNQQISALRRLLDDGSGPVCIETVPRRGYRFTCAVEPVPDVDPVNAGGGEAEIQPEVDGTPGPMVARRRTLVLAVSVFFLAVLAAALVRYSWIPPPERLEKTIAVLPFRPLVPAGSSDEHLELGIADALINKLSRVKQLTVRPTTSILRYAGAEHDPVEAGRSLKVDMILLGRFTHAGEQIRISVQLVRAADGAVVWAENFDQPFAGLLPLQDSVSERVVSALAISLSGQERLELAKNPTDNSEAYELYLKGRFHWYKWTPEGWAKAREYFQQAIEKDRKYALAYAGLADAYGVMAFVRPPSESYQPSLAAAQKALELDPNLPEAHVAMSALRLFYEWNHAAAEQGILKALDQNPNYGLGRDLYAVMLGSTGRHDAAIDQAQLALSLDPLSPYMTTDLGMAFYFARRNDQALKYLQEALELGPNHVDAMGYLVAIYEQQGEYSQAMESRTRSSVVLADQEMAENLSRGFGRGGYEGALRAALQTLRSRAKDTYVSPIERALLYARLGEVENTIDELEAALGERSPWLIWINVDPRWDGIRSHPRFAQLLEKMRQVSGTPPV